MAETSVIEALQGRITELIEAHRALAKQHSELTKQRDALQRELRASQEQQRGSEEELKKAHLALSLSADGAGVAGGDMQRARARVNNLMREIDSCIAILNKG